MIFDLENNEPKITILGIHIPEFRVIWEADETPNKEVASQIIPYIYHMVDPKSPYAKLNLESREKTVRKDYINIEGWQPSQMVQEAMDKYKLLTTTHSMRLLEGALIAADKLADYFKNINFTDMSADGKPIYNAKDLAINLSKVGSIVTSLQELKAKVEKEQTEAPTRRGNVNPSSVLH